MSAVTLGVIEQLVTIGIMYGVLYGAIAEGLTLIWGVMKIVNAAHGDFMIVGAYATYWIFVWTGIDPFALLLFTIPFGFILGAIMYVVLVRRVENSSELMTLLLTFGLSTFISSMLLNLFSPTQRSVTMFLPALKVSGLIIPLNIAFVAIYSIAVIVFLQFFLRKTFWGRAMRAVAEDRRSAVLLGINPQPVGLLAFGIGISVTASVGTMIVLLQSITPISGANFTNLSFVVAVLGGLGNPVGALVSGVLIGVIDNVASAWVNAALTPAIGFVVLLIVLLVKPSGLLGSES